MIPWFDGGHADPWNHVEAAMALDVGGACRDAERAYEWLRAAQRPDGSWHTYYLSNGQIEEPRLDTNVCAYVATGRVAPLPRDGRRRLPRGRVADGRTRHRFRRRLAAPRRRARLVRRPRRHARPLRVADRVLVGVLQSALRHRLRRRARATNVPTGSSQRVAFGTRSHTGPRASRRRTSSRWTGTTPSSPGRSIR